MSLRFLTKGGVQLRAYAPRVTPRRIPSSFRPLPQIRSTAFLYMKRYTGLTFSVPVQSFRLAPQNFLWHPRTLADKPRKKKRSPTRDSKKEMQSSEEKQPGSHVGDNEEEKVEDQKKKLHIDLKMEDESNFWNDTEKRVKTFSEVYSREAKKIKECSVHNKPRLKFFLEFNSKTKTWRCAEGQECRTSKIVKYKERDYIMCATHGKKRGEAYLVHDPVTNTWRCTAQTKCKASLPTYIKPENLRLCSTHKKIRSEGNLKHDSKTDLWSCGEETECKVGRDKPEGGNFNPSSQKKKHLCSVHNKLRFEEMLDMDLEANTWRCKPMYECFATYNRADCLSSATLEKEES